MVCVKVTFILFCCVFTANTSNINETEQYATQISVILKHLNSNPNKIYDYKKGVYVNAQKKANIVELTIDVDVTCTVNYPGIPCTEQVLTCNGFVQCNEGDCKVLSDVLCNPKQDTSVESLYDFSTAPTRSQQYSKIELSHEAISSDQNADFVAVKICDGCEFDLNTDAEGVIPLVDTALKHIETEKTQTYFATKILRLQQQVVAGIKYILTIEVSPTLCSQNAVMFASYCPLDTNAGTSVCKIIFLEKPWVNKEKFIIRNNCTLSQEYPPNSIQNGINTNPSNNKRYDLNKQREMNLQSMAELESQILAIKPEKTEPTILTNKVESISYPKKIQYQEEGTVKYEPVAVIQEFNNIFSTPSTAHEKSSDVVSYTEQPDVSTEKNINTENQAERKVTNGISTSVSNEGGSSNVPLNEKYEVENTAIQNGDIHLQETRRLKRELEDDTSETSESSESHEDNKTREKRNLDDSDSSSSESNEDKIQEEVRSKRTNNGNDNSSASDSKDSHSKNKESQDDSSTDSSAEKSHKPRRKRDLNNSDSDSSESNEDKVEGAVRSKRNPVLYTSNNIRTKRKNDDDSSLSSNSKDSQSKSKESLKSQESSIDSSVDESDKPRRTRDLDNSDSGSSETRENKVDGFIRSRRSSDFVSSHNVRIKRKNNDDDSSSNSDSSSSSESKTKEKEDKQSRNDDDSSSSSSSNSSDDKSEKKEKIKHDKNDDDSDSSNSSSSSSSSSENKSRGENEVKQNSDATKGDISLDIKINKVKRSVGQLEKITQEEKFLVRDLADFAAFSLDNIDDDDHKRVILQILSAKKLKLDGIYYHIILRLGISQCSENEDDENCREKLFADLTKICKVLVHVEDDLSNPKVVKSQCQNTKKDDRDRNRTNYSRYRRETLVGAPSNLSVDNSRIVEFTKATLSELDAQSEEPNRHKLFKIVSASSQVVAGIKYKIKIIVSLSDCLKNDTKLLEECNIPQNSTYKSCNVVVWDQPWLEHREITVKCDDKDKEYHFESKKRRRTRSYSNKIIFDKPDSVRLNDKDNSKILGRIEEQSPDNMKAFKYLKDILAYLDNQSGHQNKLKVQDIISVEKQVVAGELWRIKAIVTLSDCPQSASIDPQNCKELEGSESRTCTFKIWDRPWLPNGREVQTTCENESQPYSFRLKRSLGNPKYIIPSSLENTNEPNPKVLKYVKSGLEYLDSQSVHRTKYTIRNIKKVSRQMVAGQLWQVTAEIILSDCPKHHYIQFCEELENAESKTCNFTIWEQAWLSSSVQINITCENNEDLYSFSLENTRHINTYHTEELLNKFNDFMAKYNKSYPNDDEFSYRLKVFRDNLNTIKLLNKYEKGTARYDVTRFADMTAEEFSKSHGLRSDLRSENETPFSNAVITNIDLPTDFDWRKKGAVTEVKDQGMCGSCWAFSAIGNIEGQYAIKYGKLLEFSEQELVDCDKLDEGCNGGWMDNAYKTIEKLGGLETESDYPYEAEDEKCHFNKNKVRVKLSGALNISHNEDDMAKWLVKNGPISIAINANAMQFYVGGVSHPFKVLCNPKNLDHGVVIVGYGVDNYPKFNKTLPFWIVKNSWGSSWGEQGYYRVYRGDGTCGLNQIPSSAIVA